MRRTIFIIFCCALSYASTAQSSGEPEWKIYYDSAQLYWASDWAKTVPLLVRAERSALNDLGIYDTNYLTIVNDLGLAYARVHDYVNAEKQLTRCLAIKKEQNDLHDPGILQTMQNLATVFEGQKQWQKAQQLYEQIVSQETVVSQPVIYWTAVESLMLLYEQANDPASASQILDTHQQALSQSGNEKIRYELRLARGRVMRKLNDFEASSLVLEKLTEEVQEKDRLLYIRALHEIGILHTAMGVFSKAEKMFLLALELTRGQSADPVLRIEILNNLAALYEKLAIYDKAVAYYEEALAQHKRWDTGDNLSAITLRSNIAGIHLKVSDIPEAIRRYEAILGELKPLVPESSIFYMTVLNNLGTAYRKNGQFQDANRILSQAYALVLRYNMGNDDLASIIMNNLAVLLTATGEPEKAVPYYEKAYAIKRQLYGDQSILLTDLSGNLAVVYWALRKPDLAIPYFQKSIDLSLKQIHYIFPSLSEDEQIQFYKNLKEDFERFASIAFQSSVKYPELLTQVFNNQVTIKSLLFFTQQHRRQQILDKGDSVLLSRFESLKAKREQLGLYYQLASRDLADAQRQTAALEQEIDALQKSISLQTSETVMEAMMNKKTSWSEIKKKIRPDEALLEVVRFRKYDLKSYVQGKDDRVSFGFTDSIYYGALITTTETKKNPRAILLNEGTNLETRFLSYYRNTMRYGITDENSFQQYWHPFEAALSKKSSVYFSGDGVYHRINLNTLRAPGDNQYLLQRMDIHYIQNPAQFLTEPSSAFRTREAVLFGDPQFDAGKTGIVSEVDPFPRFAPLPGTLQEIQAVEELLKVQHWRTQAFTANRATEAHVKSVHSPAILHIATHGFFSPETTSPNSQPDFMFHSGLAFSGANLGTESLERAREDGILTAYEVMNIDLRGTNLVILSACETGLGRIENGEGVYGLQRAFLQAGARNLVISLWKVDDALTKNLMVRFYQYLFEGKSEREALKLAQLDQQKVTPSPLAWGAFIIVGGD